MISNLPHHDLEGADYAIVLLISIALHNKINKPFPAGRRMGMDE